MGRYLDALKKVEILRGDYPNKPKELEKGGILGLLGTPSPRFEINNAANEETAIRAWLSHINETDTGIINDLLDKCQQDAEARAYFTGQAADTVPIKASEITQRETRHQKVIAVLEDSPDKQRAYYTDVESDPHNVILVIGIRHWATFEMLIDKAKYDPWRLLELINGQTTH